MATACDGSPRVCVLMGSPCKGGSCATLAQAFSEGLCASGCQPRIVRALDYDVRGCVGCGACSRTGACFLAGEDGFAELHRALNGAQALVVVAPVFFSGPSSQLKAILDRLQPLWARRYVLGTRPALPMEERRPLLLVPVGAGGDPFGHDAFTSCCRSSLRMLDFESAGVEPFVGEGRFGDEALDRARLLGEGLGRSVCERYHSGNIYPVRDEDLGRAVFETR